MAPRPPQEVARQVLEIESQAIRDLLPQLDGAFDAAVEMLRACKGRVVCTGMGKSGLVMQKVAATLSSTGTPAMFLHPAEAIHGDLGTLVAGDVVLAASLSGTTEEIVRLVETLRRLGVPLIAITGKPGSPLARLADLHLSVAIRQEACPLNLAPTASTTATLALGDALAMAVMEARGFTPDDFALRHPGGQLGKRLLRVHQLMHRGDQVPRVGTETPMREAIYEMSRKGLGVTAVVTDGDRLVGILSDGDLRRLLERDESLLGKTAGECMRRGPKTIAGDELASAALKKMEDFRITSLFVVDGDGRLEGVVHIHDLWRLELF
jgi:arabinose-5-phosphate isomerase